MIIYDLQCPDGHLFEGWFESVEEFDRESGSGLLTCPVCDKQEVTILPSGGHFAKRPGSSENPPTSHGGSRIKAFTDYLERNFDDVGSRFAEEAEKIHFGESNQRNIRGTMTSDEETDLLEIGVEFYRVSIPKLHS